MRLDQDLISQIQKSDKSITETAKELWIDRHTVSKYRQWISGVLSGKEEEQRKASKEEKRKLDLLKTYSSKEVQDMLTYIANNTKKEIDEVLWEEGHLKFWLVSDTHIWAKQAAVDELWEFYDKAKDKGVECFVHAGDLLDWEWVYTGQQFEQSEVWMDDQINKLVKDYPDVWVPTYFIQWNHDQAFLKRNWADVWKTISLLRDDLKYLGIYDATLKINWIKINLHHWAWASSYSWDYKLQRYIDSLDPKQLPDVVGLGHYHRALYSLHNGIHSFLPGAFLKENLLCKRYNFPNQIWWWIVELEKKPDGKSHLNIEFIKL